MQRMLKLAWVCGLISAGCDPAGGGDAFQGEDEQNPGFVDSGGHKLPKERVVALFEPQMVDAAALELPDGKLLVGGIVREDGLYSRRLYLVSLTDGNVEELPRPFASTDPPGFVFGMAPLPEQRVLLINAPLGTSESTVLDLTSMTYRPVQTPGIAPSHVVPLPDGKVLWTDGPRRAAVFDPTSEAWSLLSEQPGSAGNGTASVLSDGRVLLTGLLGNRYDDPPAAFIFSPDSLSFSNVAAPSLNREGAGSIRLPDGRVLLFGGRPLDGNSEDGLDSTEIYDPALDTWSEGPKLFEPVAFGEGFSHGSDTYLLGGIGGEPCATADCGLERVHRLRAGATSFEAAPDLHPAGAGPLTVVREGVAYLVSGMGIFRYALPER